MDITLLRDLNATNATIGNCFNPCFNGYYTSTMKISKKELKGLGVSILVLMDITLLHYVTELNYQYII